MSEFMNDIAITTQFKGINDETNMFDWRVTLTRDGRQHVMEIGLGFGHCKRSARPVFGAIKIEKDNKKLVRALVPSGRVVIADLEGYIVPTPPTLTDALQLLQRDAQSGEYLLFEDFASDCGYDADSRAAEKIWHTCQEIRGRSMKFFGNDFQNFMDHNFDE